MLITEKIDLEDDWKKRIGEQYLIVTGTTMFELCVLEGTEDNCWFVTDCLSAQNYQVNDSKIKAIYELTWIPK